MTHPLYRPTHLVDQFLWHTYSVSIIPHPCHSLYCISCIFHIFLCEFLLHSTFRTSRHNTHTAHQGNNMYSSVTCVALPALQIWDTAIGPSQTLILPWMFPSNVLSSTPSACGSGVLLNSLTRMTDNLFILFCKYLGPTHQTSHVIRTALLKLFALWVWGKATS